MKTSLSQEASERSLSGRPMAIKEAQPQKGWAKGRRRHREEKWLYILFNKDIMLSLIKRHS